MSEEKSPDPSTEQNVTVIEVELREPGVAAFWAWLWPGAGHLYQKRYAKGVLFMVCILGTFFYGLTLGGGRVVYAYWGDPPERRYHFICQIAVGAPALPALVQSFRVNRGMAPLFGGFMAPPEGDVDEREAMIRSWYKKYDWRYEMGTLFTMVAGLLNVLAIYDAFAGPVLPPPPEEDKKKKKRAPPKKKPKS